MEEEPSLRERQDMILEWLKSKGHRISLTDEEREIRGCKSKRYYSSLVTASRAAAVVKQTVYRCDYCDGFHLTSRR